VATKKRLNSESQSEKHEEGVFQGELSRERKIMNLIVNTSIILMSTLMGGLSQVMVDTMGAAASGVAGALSGEETAEQVIQEFDQKSPEIDEKMKAMISDLRKDVYVQLGQKGKEIDSFLSEPVFDKGLQKVDKYDFKLPKLTEELDDTSLARYAQLLVIEDPDFSKLFGELGDWMNALPKFPEKIDN
jgi:hypothetical protein